MEKWLGALILLACTAGTATAQSSYPNRAITLIVTSAPGGVTDVTGRALAQELTKAWGQPVIVENKGGAAHIIGAQTVAKSPPDGYTLLVGESGTFAVNPTLIPKDKVPYDTEKDFTAITGLVRIYQSLLTAKSLPVANAAELIALCKAKPDQLTYGTAGVGTALHMNGALFATMAGIKLVPVHYRGASPALNDLIGGSINTMIVSVSLGLPAYRAGQIKMLDVGAPKRFRFSPTLSRSTDVRIDGRTAERLHRVRESGAREMGQAHCRRRYKDRLTNRTWRYAMSALPPKADIGSTCQDVHFVPKADVSTRSKQLFDYFLSEQLQRAGYLNAKRSGQARPAICGKIIGAG